MDTPVDNDIRDLATWAVRSTLAGGAQECRVGIRAERFVEVTWRARRPECIREASQRRLDVAVYADGRYSEQGTSDLRRETLSSFLERAVQAARLLEPDPHRCLPDPALYRDRWEADLGCVDPGYPEMTSERRHDAARIMEDACLGRGGGRMVSATATHRDSRAESVQIASNGFEGREQSTAFWSYVEATVQDEGDRRPNGYYWVGSPMRGALPDPAAVGALAADRALELLGGRKIPTCTLPVIVENRVVPRLLLGLLEAMLGQQVQQERSFLAGSRGRRIAGECLSLVDDPLLPGGLASRTYDADGISGRRRLMIDRGVLAELYVDWYYSRKLGVPPTTGGFSNTLILPGTRSVGRIMRDLGRGVLVTDFIGGSSNSVTGDLSLGIVGKLFEGGEPGASLAEMNIAANHRELWPRLREVADDPWPYAEMRTPSLVFDDVVISGR